MAPRTVYTSRTADVMQRALNAQRIGLWKAGQEALRFAMDSRLVPLDTGTLLRSGVVTTEMPNMQQVFRMAQAGSMGLKYTKPPGQEFGGRGRIGYGFESAVRMFVSYNTPYAARLHEGVPPWTPRAVNSKGNPKPAQGQPKWLDLAAQRVTPMIPRLVAIEMKASGF